MIRTRALIAAAAFCAALPLSATAQKSGGTLRIYNTSNPPSLSIHEEGTIATVMPIMSIFNNLVLFDQTKPLGTLETIVPDLAESWSLDDTRTKLTFKLRQGVTWHDGKPFTAKDVACTWHRLNGKEPDYFRKNPRKVWYDNLKEVTVDGDLSATFHLEQPQPSFLALLASGMSPVYPCHLDAKDMRTKPVGTGPFKFVEFTANTSLKVARNLDYWRKGFPYLDGISWLIIANRSTRVLAFTAGEFDMTFIGDVTMPILEQVMAQAPKAICKIAPTNVSANLIVNNTRPPFDDAKIRRAMMLGLDRQGFIDILTQGKALISGAMMPPPEGGWGMPRAELDKLPGYAGTLDERQAEARKIMEAAGYGPAKRLKVKVSTRDFQAYKDPAVILVDQLNKIYFEAELETVESTVWFGRMLRMDFAVGLNLSGHGIDDPDAVLKEGYACKSENNFTKYCNPEVERLLSEQSREADVIKRRQLVWDIEKILISDVARPMIYHGRVATCWHPHLKGIVRNENSIYNDWRMEHFWLDK
jgi:peptide/nickel transport system substrate-binding protein